MDFTHTEERRMLGETIARFLADNYTMETRNKLAESDEGFSRDYWARMAELGIIGALFSEEDGGFGGKGFDISAVFEELGRAAVVEPFLQSGVLGGGLIAALGSDAQKAVLESVMAGETLVALAHGEPEGRYELAEVATRAEQEGSGWKLAGQKAVVTSGDSADLLVVSARVSGALDDPDGIALFLVDANAEGIERRGYPTMDGGRAAEIALNGVTVEGSALLGKPGAAYEALEAACAAATLAICAEAVGAMEASKELTLEYLRTRTQFGRPIGQFQALQHRMADVLIEIEQARSSVINAAGHLDADRLTRERSVSAAKNMIGRVGKLVAEETIQLHGGIGMTHEYALPHFAKRIVMIDHMLGDSDHHLQRYIELAREAS